MNEKLEAWSPGTHGRKRAEGLPPGSEGRGLEAWSPEREEGAGSQNTWASETRRAGSLRNKGSRGRMGILGAEGRGSLGGWSRPLLPTLQTDSL